MKVVTTKVGGIPEVLPEDLVYLTEPTVPGLLDGKYMYIYYLLKMKYYFICLNNILFVFNRNCETNFWKILNTKIILFKGWSKPSQI